MKNNTYPLAVPDELLSELRECASATGLSVADTMRQSMKLGLPKLKKQLANRGLKPFTKEETRLAFQTPNPEFDALEHHCASLPKRLPEDE
jgi:hypothetical protein